MNDSPATNRAAVLRQQLQTDRLLGVDALPISVDQLRRAAQPSGGGPASAARTRRADPARAESLKVLDETQVTGCEKCHLCRTRTKTVFGQGSPDARLVFVGEAPGYDEDQQGLAFVGRAGQLLSRMIAAMGLSRDDVFICNVLKCRPPENRTPTAEETTACSPYLFEQLSIIEPEVLVALGKPAAQTLLNSTDSIGRLRGRFHEFFPSGAPMVGDSIPLMPTYHPAYLLRSPGEKVKAWDDLKKVMEMLGLEIPKNYR